MQCWRMLKIGVFDRSSVYFPCICMSPQFQETLPGVPVVNICIKTCQHFIFFNIRLIPTFHVSLDSIYSSAAERATILILISLTVCVLRCLFPQPYEPAQRVTLFLKTNNPARTTGSRNSTAAAVQSALGTVL
jgi:hypothetical protein